MLRRLSFRSVNTLKRISKYHCNTHNYTNYQPPKNQEMINYLRSNGLNVIEKYSGGITSETCPLCPKPHNSDKSNLWTLNFKQDSGLFICFRCGSSGNWNQFKKYINPTETDPIDYQSNTSNTRHDQYSNPLRVIQPHSTTHLNSMGIIVYDIILN